MPAETPMPGQEFSPTPEENEKLRRGAYIAIVWLHDPKSYSGLHMLLGKVRPPEETEIVNNPNTSLISALIKKHNGNLWSLIGGALNEEESAEQDSLLGEENAARREMEEETGLTAKRLIFLAKGPIENPFKRGEMQDATLFLLEYVPSLGDPTPSSEMDEVAWVNIDEIDKYIGLGIRLAFLFVLLHYDKDAITPEVLEKLSIPEEILQQIHRQ